MLQNKIKLLPSFSTIVFAFYHHSHIVILVLVIYLSRQTGTTWPHLWLLPFSWYNLICSCLHHLHIDKYVLLWHLRQYWKKVNKWLWEFFSFPFIKVKRVLSENVSYPTCQTFCLTVRSQEVKKRFNPCEPLFCPHLWGHMGTSGMKCSYYKCNHIHWGLLLAKFGSNQTKFIFYLFLAPLVG